MAAPLDVESTLTDRYQTTVPETVRRVLKLGKRDKIHYSILPDGAVVLSRVNRSTGDDPLLAQFLEFLADDMGNHPERLQSLHPTFVRHIQSMVASVEVDLEAPLSTDDE
jgi:antitoxin PrlF